MMKDMKRLSKIFAALFLTLAIRASAQAAESDPALDKLLKLAAENNPAIFAAKERVNQARADVRSAAAQMGPSLTGEATGRLGRDFPGGAREAYTASLGLVQVVYSGSRLSAQEKSRWPHTVRRSRGGRQDVSGGDERGARELLRSVALGRPVERSGRIVEYVARTP
jgi:outer membrane protein TolC